MGRIGHAELLDRDRELSAVCALLDDAASGAGGLLLVEGEAGIGKTGIVRAAAALARTNGVRVLGARGGELESGLAFGMVREMFSEPIRAAHADGDGALFAGAAALARPVLEPAVEPVLDESHDCSPPCMGSIGLSQVCATRARSCSQSTTHTGASCRRFASWPISRGVWMG